MENRITGIQSNDTTVDHYCWPLPSIRSFENENTQWKNEKDRYKKSPNPPPPNRPCYWNKIIPPPHYPNNIMTRHANFCWNQDECNICTPNYHEIRLTREAETLAKQTNKANGALWQSTQIWSAEKEELVIWGSLCEKTPMTWTPPCWKCSYKWTEIIYLTRSIVMCPSCGAGQPMAELLTYWVESHHPETHHDLFTGNNQLGRQNGELVSRKTEQLALYCWK